ncbi:hypothetical protein NKDENANG_00070 [Candidatus Entotheonellaceae bacterium PAL068K]
MVSRLAMRDSLNVRHTASLAKLGCCEMLLCCSAEHAIIGTSD